MPVLSGLFAAILFAILTSLLKKYLEKLPYRRILGFSKDEPILIVFPSRRDEPLHKGLLRDTRVTFEDMLAVNYVERMLTLSGCPDFRVQMREHKGFRKLDVHDSAKNIVLICSPKSNEITQEYLKKINDGTNLNWKFGEDDKGQLFISTNPGKWESATYDQEKELKKDNKIVGESTLDDMAVIIRAPNPYNPKAKILIIAGIRGIGSWGAAKYFRQNAKSLDSKTKGNDFALIVKIKYEGWRIQQTTDTEIFKIIKANQK